MKMKVTSYSEQSSLLSAIIFFILGAILYTQADAVLSFISLTISIILIITAIINIIYIIFEAKGEEPIHKSHIFGAVFSIFFAIIFIFFSSIVEQFIRFIIGGWILFSGIMRFINSISISPKVKRFLPLLIVSILLMATGIYTIITSGATLKLIGIVMMIYAAIEIVGYIFYTKDTLKPVEPGSTTLIVPDSENTDINNDKVVKTIKEKDIKTKKKKSSRKKKDEEEK